MSFFKSLKSAAGDGVQWGDGESIVSSLAQKDYSQSLRSSQFLNLATLTSGYFALPGGSPTALAYDPIQGFLAVGTEGGGIAIFGKESVVVRWKVGDSPVRFLAFQPGRGRLIVIDAKQWLQVVSTEFLDAHGLPVRDAIYSVRNTVTCIDLSPSHNHLMLALKDGTIDFYDLDRCNHSPYRVPNLWAQHEELMRRSGVPGRKPRGYTPLCTAVQQHPRDMNQLLVGYEGGACIWDIKNNSVIRSFELILPPGAPGGGNYPDDLLFTERTPTVTSLAWRPDGLVFVLGHDDGSLSFWSVDDDDRPLMVCTTSEGDTNVANGEAIFSASESAGQSRAQREPVFKLAWASWPEKADGVGGAGQEYAARGETVLTMLGGLLPTEQPGITLFRLPPFQPPLLSGARPPTSPTGGGGVLSPDLRAALRASVTPPGTLLYPTRSPPEDFLLLPGASPHFGAAFDPVAIVIVTGTDSTLPELSGPSCPRGVEAWSFPPPTGLVPPSPQLPPGTPPPSAGLLPSASSQSSFHIPPPPQDALISYRLPAPFLTGAESVLGVEIAVVPPSSYKRLVPLDENASGNAAALSAAAAGERRLPLFGGSASPDWTSKGAPDQRTAKLEHRKIMVTYSLDATVRFWDISPHLLLYPDPLTVEYPRPLPQHTISVRDLLSHPSLSHLPAAQLLHTSPRAIRIRSVRFAAETLECTITLRSGEVLLTKFGLGKSSAVAFGSSVDAARRELHDLDSGAGAEEGMQKMSDMMADLAREMEADLAAEKKAAKAAKSKKIVKLGVRSSKAKVNPPSFGEITDLREMADLRSDGFKPVAMLSVGRGEPIACAVTDIGFVAVAYQGNALAIVDLRGPTVIYREGYGEPAGRSHSESEPVEALRWAVCGIDGDPLPTPRLIVSYGKGLNKVITLSTSDDGRWGVVGQPATFAHGSLSNMVATFVLDARTGAELPPSTTALQDVQRAKRLPPGGPHQRVLWLAVARKALRIKVDVTGETLTKVTLENKIVQATLMHRNSAKALLAIDETGKALFFSLPNLDLVQHFPLRPCPNPAPGPAPPAVPVTISHDGEGDFVQYTSPVDIQFRTFFNFRRPREPLVTLHNPSLPVPAQPGPVNASGVAALTSWLWGSGTITGDQLDTLIAGPNRPPPRPPRQRRGEESEPEPEPAVGASTARRTQRSVQSTARGGVFDRMQNALAERGEYLNDVEERFNRLAVGAGEMATQAQRVAAKESAKRAFGSWF